MHLTEQQKNILASGGDIKINAVAGSGKTTTLIEFARRLPSHHKILYLVFNRSVRLEAQHKFEKAGLDNASVHTAHSLAFKHIVPRYGYEIIGGYKPHEIRDILGLSADTLQPLYSQLLAGHIGRLCSLFCGSAAEKVADLEYPATLADAPAKAFAQQHHAAIVQGARKLLAKMDRCEIKATHEFYLKKFQLEKPDLGFDCVLFDEGQDASPVMLDVFLRQNSRKVIVGDIYQQIYSWRHAVNALANVEFAEYPLTTSFRFGPKIAALAMEILTWKKHLGIQANAVIEGMGKNGRIRSCATLARTNLGLLRSAIDTISHNRSVKKIWFEGNLSSYMYAAEGASLWDVLSLYQGRREKIRDRIIGGMTSFEQLKEYASTADDMEMHMMIDLVEEYEESLPYHISRLKKMHVDEKERASADMIFSTVHRCKGLEYDEVRLVDDFITEARLEKLSGPGQKPPADAARFSEEINLLYVAVTRARTRLVPPAELFDNWKGPVEKRKPKRAAGGPREKAGFSFPVRKRRDGDAAEDSWTPAQDAELTGLAEQMTVSQLADRFQRSEGGIRSRLKKLREKPRTRRGLFGLLAKSGRED
jgi:superfamily I DNA/RNA helicase